MPNTRGERRQGFVNARLNQLKMRLAEMSMIDYSKFRMTGSAWARR